MHTVGVFAHFEFKLGEEKKAAEFFKNGLAIADQNRPDKTPSCSLVRQRLKKGLVVFFNGLCIRWYD